MAASDPDEILRYLTGVAWGDGLFVTINGKALISSDGINWKEGRDGTHFGDIIWAGTHFVSVGNNGGFATSSNGSDWSDFGTSTSQRLDGVAYSGPQFFDGGRS